MIQRVENLIQILKFNLPGFNIKFKNESTFMKIIGYLLFFNKNFMTGVVTTIGSTIYFPNKESLENRTEQSLVSVLTHEYTHAKDFKKYNKFIFSFLYLFPQILSPLMWFFAFYSPILALILFLLFLVPIPAPFRTYFELRAYKISLFSTNEILKERLVSEEIRRQTLLNSIGRYNEKFTKSLYYFMWPFGVKNELNNAIENIISERIYNEDDIFLEIATAIKNSKEL